MIEKLLQYQKLDLELLKLNRELASCPEKATMNKMIAFVKDAQNKSSMLERKAKDLLAEYNTVKNAYDETLKNVEKLTKLDASKLDNDKLQEMSNQVNVASSELFGLEKKLNVISSKAKEVLKEFDMTKSNVIKARTKHRESKEQYEKRIESLEPKKNEILAKMAELEKEADKTMLAKYKSIKNDNIFPVFVPLHGNLCGGCRMVIPSGQLDKIKSAKIARCEQCGRILYIQ